LSTNQGLRNKWFRLLAIVILALFGSTSAGIAESQVDLTALQKEISQTYADTERLISITWFPVEFWEIMLKKDGHLSATEIQLFVDIVKPYNMFMILDASVTPSGKLKYQDEKDISKTLVLIDTEKTAYAPLADAEIDPVMRKFLKEIREPLIKSMSKEYGRLGKAVAKNIHFFLFSSKNGTGVYYAVPTQPGSLTIKVDSYEFKWNFPLVSLAPPSPGAALPGF
jgi:hypothetical protein